MDKADAQAKKHAERETKKNLAPAASAKLAEKQGDVSKLAKAEIAAILYVDYADDISLTKHKKPELVKRLEDNINENPNDPATASSAEDPMLKEESNTRSIQQQWPLAGSVVCTSMGVRARTSQP
jgi:hypothetical protein